MEKALDAVKICIAICTCNRGPLLERLLRSLSEIDLGDLDRSQVEIIVVHNAASGEARAVGERVAADLPLALGVIEEPQRGISYARNRAVAEALKRGADFVAFIDDDDLPHSDWLLRLVEKQRQSGAPLVFGVWRPLIGSNTPAWARDLPMLQERDHRVLHKYGVGLPRGVATCNVLIGRGVLRLAFRRGSSNMHIARLHSTPEQLKRRWRSAVTNLVLGCLLAPVYVFSMSSFVKNLYEISNKLGCLHALFGKRYNYYQ